MRLKAFLTAIAVLGVSTLANAAFVPWTNSTGMNTFVHWSNGGSTGGLWGDPTVSGLTFSFNPTNFRAESDNGVPTTVDSLLQFNLDILPDSQGHPQGLTGFALNEGGLYSITGTGAVQASNQIDITNDDAGPGFGTVTGSTKSFGPITQAVPLGGTSGGWAIVNSVVLANAVTHVTITIDNNLQAISGTGSTSYIDKKFGDGTLSITLVVPEPATASLLLAGSGLLLSRRRRKI